VPIGGANCSLLGEEADFSERGINELEGGNGLELLKTRILSNSKTGLQSGGKC